MAQGFDKVITKKIFMKKNTQKLIDILGEDRVAYAESLTKYCSFHIGGPADLFYRAKNSQELIIAVKSAWKLSVPIFVLGGGTNVLISDRGFRGLVIKNDTGGIKLLGIKGRKTGEIDKENNSVQTVYLEVESGVSINRLVRYTLDQGFAGLEYFLGQPGTLGGAMFINAHNIKKGIFLGDKIYQARILQKNGKITLVDSSYFHFGYDKSIIQKNGDIVLSAVISLKRADKNRLWKEAQEILEYRQMTQPHGIFSAGCTFRNISKSDAIRIATPNYTTSAGFLLDSLGLKGEKIGESMFSQHHANFIVNKGMAVASDVLELIKLAKEKAKERYNINLHEEIILVGEF